MDYLMKKRISCGLCLLALLCFSVLNAVRAVPELAEEAREVGFVPEKLEAELEEELLADDAMTEIRSFAAVALGKREMSNYSYIRDEDGYIHFGAFYRERNQRLFEYAARVYRLSASVAEKGTKVLYVSPPAKYLRQAVRLAPGLQANDQAESMEELLFYLFRMNIPILDLAEAFRRGDVPYLENFYRTDRNWTVDAAFRAAGLLVEDIRERWGEDLDPENFYTDPANYRVKTYRGRMFGSLGRATGQSFTPPEDFRLYLPRFEGTYRRSSLDSGRWTEEEGSFRRALLDTELLEAEEEGRSLYESSLYNLYLNGYNDFDHIENLSAGEGKPRILVICDSYFSPVISFLAPMCSVIDRVYNLYTGEECSVERRLAENEYDYVIIEVYPYNLDEDAFNYFVREEE